MTSAEYNLFMMFRLDKTPTNYWFYAGLMMCGVLSVNVFSQYPPLGMVLTAFGHPYPGCNVLRTQTAVLVGQPLSVAIGVKASAAKTLRFSLRLALSHCWQGKQSQLQNKERSPIELH